MNIGTNMGLLGLLAAFVAAPWGGVQAAETEEAFEKYKNIIEYDAFNEYATIPVRDDVVIIDARPTRKKYDVGHIPGAINIPNTFFDKMVDQLPADKGKMLIFYCGGHKCPLSHKSAVKAEALGYTNITVYSGGQPEWVAKGNFESVSAAYVKDIVDKPNGAVIIDARPKGKQYDVGHIPGAINIPNTFFDKMVDQLPADKGTELIFYCGGPKCPLSFKSATKAKALGYTNIKLFQAGYPAWEAAYGPGVAADGAAAAPKAEVANAEAPKAEAPKVQTGGDGSTITLESFQGIMASAPDSIFLVDVRDPGEFGKRNFANSINIPVEELEDRIGELPTDKPVVFVCSTGARSSEAFDITKMLREELKHVYYLDAEITFNADGTQTFKAN
ncbi:MAG: rhodanese-like domain-containing protein [Alphaproteobacteria bacterium]|nr:rhodanese-like domain-containing protein [Alphaproteobacteria bacterium]